MISDSGKRESDAVVHWVGPRGRRILHTGAWSMVAKIAAAANLFLTVPFVLHALGPDGANLLRCIAAFDYDAALAAARALLAAT